MNETSPSSSADPATGTAASVAGNAAPAPQTDGNQRVYEQSGCYPADGKQFRLWALLGWLSLVIIGLAAAAAILNIYFLGAPWKAG
jgi:hypothetical protein